MNNHLIKRISLILVLLSSNAFALDNILRPYQSVRTSAMGGVKITTGLYDQNFFGNPARVTANPEDRYQLIDPLIEVNTNTVGAIGDLTSGGTDDILSKASSYVGKNLHLRYQMTFPGIYLPGRGKWSYAFSIITSLQTDVALRRSFQADPAAVIDIGPALTIGRKMLVDDRLSVGVTPHFTYRLSTKEGYSLADLFKGESLSPSKSGGQGAHIDVDLGATYKLHWKWAQPFGFKSRGGLSINNVLGGTYGNIGFKPIQGLNNAPRKQPRAVNIGVATERDSIWILHDWVIALEFTDILNNEDGSLFRLLHIGTEAKWRILSWFALIPRGGINQGYLTGGLGLDLRYFTLDYAYWAEEMGLNVGQIEDRRHTLRLSFHI